MENQPTPRLSEQEAKVVAERALRDHAWVYDAEYGLRPVWRGRRADVLGKLGALVGVWSVNFLTPPDGPFDQESRFVEVNDDTGTALGVITAHNYFQFE